ncbi:MAG: transcriptional regulator [Kiritimatiellae bacterium]|nr:transcriptional regulator [Kiritimatiellia bacterium]
MRKTTPKEVDASRDDFGQLAASIARLRGRDAVEAFLRDLFTPSECVEFSNRWALVRELLAGKPQRAVARELGMSLCKITRGAKFVRDPASPFRRAVLAARAARK